MIPTLERCLEANKADQLAFLQQLIRADTTTLGHGILGGYERLGQDVILARLKAMDCDRIDVWEPDNQLLSECAHGLALLSSKNERQSAPFVPEMVRRQCNQ